MRLDLAVLLPLVVPAPLVVHEAHRVPPPLRVHREVRPPVIHQVLGVDGIRIRQVTTVLPRRNV